MHAYTYIHTCTHTHTFIYVNVYIQQFKQYADFQKLMLFWYSALFYTHQAEIWLIYMKMTLNHSSLYGVVHCDRENQCHGQTINSNDFQTKHSMHYNPVFRALSC